jgi:hypothetical protein
MDGRIPQYKLKAGAKPKFLRTKPLIDSCKPYPIEPEQSKRFITVADERDERE